MNGKLNPAESKFWIGSGICFPNTTALEEEIPAGMPKHEPFFFVIIADDWRSKKASALLGKGPEGWLEIWEGFGMVATRAASKFEADPDLRVRSLIGWSQDEVGHALACIPNFETTPVEDVPEES